MSDLGVTNSRPALVDTGPDVSLCSHLFVAPTAGHYAGGASVPWRKRFRFRSRAWAAMNFARRRLAGGQAEQRHDNVRCRRQYLTYEIQSHGDWVEEARIAQHTYV